MLWEQILMTIRRPWPHCFRSILQSFVYEINLSEPMRCVWMLTFICTHLHLQVTDLEEQLLCYQVSAGVSRAIASIIAIVFLVFQPATTTQWQVYWFSHCNKDMGVEGFTFLMHIWTNNVICDGCYQMGLALMNQAPHFCSCADTSKKSLSKRAWIFFLFSKTPWSTSSICVWEQETPFNSSTSTRCNAFSSGCTCKFQTCFSFSFSKSTESCATNDDWDNFSSSPSTRGATEWAELEGFQFKLCSWWLSWGEPATTERRKPYCKTVTVVLLSSLNRQPRQWK